MLRETIVFDSNISGMHDQYPKNIKHGLLRAYLCRCFLNQAQKQKCQLSVEYRENANGKEHSTGIELLVNKVWLQQCQQISQI